MQKIFFRLNYEPPYWSPGKFPKITMYNERLKLDILRMMMSKSTFVIILYIGELLKTLG